jgi:hypothetical protein
MTSTAAGLFSQTVTPQKQKYEFEKIAGLSLDWIRCGYPASERERYTILLNKIAQFTPTDPTNDLNDFLRSFYEHKNEYYQLVTDAIALESENDRENWNL